jgi:sec-independent protein translocase protein TatB
MFDIGAGELLVIGVVALVVIGPKELPAVLRQAGKFTNKVRQMAGEFRSQFDEAMRESELHEAKKQIASLNPFSEVQNQIKDVNSILNKNFEEPAQAQTPEVISEPIKISKPVKKRIYKPKSTEKKLVSTSKKPKLVKQIP